MRFAGIWSFENGGQVGAGLNCTFYWTPCTVVTERMEPANRQSWLRVAVLIGAVYVLVGVVFALPSGHVRGWRLAAWIVSGVAYAIHLWYERIWSQRSCVRAALDVGIAAALGALGLAVAANIHAQSVATSNQQQQRLALALVAWPLITGVPAFLAGLGAGALLARLSRRGTSVPN